MVHDSHGLHHFHRRKRIHLHHEPYPHPDALKRVMDKLIYVVGVFGPIMTVPQVVKIWIEQNAAGISLVSWVAYLITALFWLAYGVLHKEKPIIFTYLIWVFLDILIITGVAIYA
jgi:uncharacterized protein with PQ loop repeat